ncbi:MAG: flagellar biosynthesis anti-sigma factor FlgM [Oscillospiraceae bacterium]|nr:flagellar biosynthesis anti-sigma factor FlgM [Oscillospiraceae bacterium]
MIIQGTEGYLPIQNKTAQPVGSAGRGRRAARSGRYDRYTLSAPAEQGGFRELTAALAQQVRAHNTTGKIQELRSQVRDGQYSIEPRETAARMLFLTEEGE